LIMLRLGPASRMARHGESNSPVVVFIYSRSPLWCKVVKTEWPP
jgi:hypothetical protein